MASVSELCDATSSTYSAFAIILGNAVTPTVNPGSCEPISPYRPIQVYGNGPGGNHILICTWDAAGMVGVAGSLATGQWHGCY